MNISRLKIFQILLIDELKNMFLHSLHCRMIFTIRFPNRIKLTFFRYKQVGRYFTVQYKERKSRNNEVTIINP